MVTNDDVASASGCFITVEEMTTLRHTNEVIGDYVTAYARPNVYAYRDILQDRALYSDTENVLLGLPNNKPALVETGTITGP